MPKKEELMANYIRFNDPSVPLDDGMMEVKRELFASMGKKKATSTISVSMNTMKQEAGIPLLTCNEKPCLRFLKLVSVGNSTY